MKLSAPTRQHAPPAGSLLAGIDFHYCNSYAVMAQTEAAPPGAASMGRAFFRSWPPWMRRLLRLRNFFAARFGLVADQAADSRSEAFSAKPGERVGLFQVYESSERELVMGADDRHLNFRLSLYAERSDGHGIRFVLSTIVGIHNIFGTLYFAPVRIMHRLIGPGMFLAWVRQIELGDRT